MASKKSPKQDLVTKGTADEKLTLLMDHYTKSVEDMDTRRIRKNGWDEVIDAYMSKLPANWPYTSMVTDPMIRTTILEKTSRLLNSKLQGRLIPREGGDVIKARINNAVLDFQWDYADKGGSMVEKVAMADQITRLFGAAFAYVYWDNSKNSNEIKICDPRDVFVDFSANHIKNAKWIQYREYVTIDALDKMGYDVKEAKEAIANGDVQNSDLRSNNYQSAVKRNYGLDDKLGKDLSNPVVEFIREFTCETVTAFLPRYGKILKLKDSNEESPKNPYDHGRIPFAMLRYYPLGDEVYGESEVESVISLQRAADAILCGFIDAVNLSTRPPLKLLSGQYQKGSIEYGPGAQWIINTPGAVEEAKIGEMAIANFNSAYPAIKAAFGTAMGDQSLGVSTVAGRGFQDKTATEVINLEKQQNNRDQYNQLYLSEFLKDIMLMWLSNNQQYLFDDPSKQYFVVKIIGKDSIQQFQNMLLDSQDIPDHVAGEIANVMQSNPGSVTPEDLMNITKDTSLPSNPVVLNPNEENPGNYQVKPKLDVAPTGDMADLYVSPDDMVGLYDYIPDVKSMSAGAGVMMQQARQKALELALNPQVNAMLQTQGEMLKIKEVLIGTFEDAGYKDAESLFQSAGGSPVQPGGQPAINPIQAPGGMAGAPSVQAAVPPQAPGAQLGGIPQPQGF